MANIYEIITDRILDALENGCVPWHKDWRDAAISHSTGKGYRGINALLLDKPGEYATFNQIKEAGGHVKKGARGYPVVLYKMVTSEKDGEEKTFPLPIRYYTVFHLDDCEGVERKYIREPVEHDSIPEAEAVILDYSTRTNLTIDHLEQNRAYYSLSSDKVVLPLKTQFETLQGYYSTIFHELGHSTGHKSRLNRSTLTEQAAFGSATYSREELVAEITSAMISSELGFTSELMDNSVAYCAGWAKALKANPKMILQAANAAQRASDLILGRSFEEAAQ